MIAELRRLAAIGLLASIAACSGGAGAVTEALDRLLAGKPKGHQFRIEAARPAVERHMSVTGG